MMTSPSTTAEYWFIFQDAQLLIIEQNNIPTHSFVTSMKPFFLRQYPITKDDKFNVYCAELPGEFVIPANSQWVPLRKALELLGKEWYSIATKSYSIIRWDKNHRYCGCCGNQTQLGSATFERICTVCSLTFYPRISPSVIVLIQKNDQILMARSPHFTPRAYGLIAGFVEPGETIEEATHREVKEETGLEIKNLRYFGSQSWPFPDSLIIAFTAEYASGELTINHEEIEDAGWYNADNMPGRPSSSISIASKLIDSYVLSQKSKND